MNVLCNQKRLAFASKTPGRTQHINYFGLFAKDDLLAYLVDLPGYGYAKVPEAMRNHWQSVLSRYLSERSSLAGLVLVMDSRHPLTPLDRQMLDWFSPSGRPVHVLLTKSDKLSRSECALTLNRVRKELNDSWGNCSVQLFSSSKKQGVEEAEKVIASWLFANDSDPAKHQIPDPVT
ncbi:MAG: YihA family ribosome biogenesis GTP-binding protein [Methylophilaceae bacterium 17-44-8]|nr:MAG: YihA family ribosome biogenesis GTP-binding protein [Methylophilaceae bacterium 17-44-8]